MELTNQQQQVVVKKLELGLKRLREDGWCQGAAFKTEDGHKVYCAWGAAGGRGLGGTNMHYLANALNAGIKKVSPRHNADGPWSVFDWNDKKGRKKAQVVKAFREAIKIAKRSVKL